MKKYSNHATVILKRKVDKPKSSRYRRIK